MRKNTLTLIFGPFIRPKIPAFYHSDTATKRRKVRKKTDFNSRGILAESIDRCQFFQHRFRPKKKFGLVTSATNKIVKTGFHSAKEHFELHFSAYHSAEISGILQFQSRNEKPERDKKYTDIISMRNFHGSIVRCHFYRH